LKLFRCEAFWSSLNFKHQLVYVDCNERAQFFYQLLCISVAGWDSSWIWVRSFNCVVEDLNLVVTATWAVKQSEAEKGGLCEDVRVYFAKPSRSRCEENWRGEELSKRAIRILQISPCFSLVWFF
jgi:hypothetical protein